MNTIFVNEFICSFENKERLLRKFTKNTVKQIQEIGENIIKKIEKDLSFFKPYSFKSNEPIEEVCFKTMISVPDFQDFFYFIPNNRFKTTLEEFKDNVWSDFSFKLVNFIFNYCIDKFNLKPINDSYKKYFLQKNEEAFFYKNCCFDKHFFKKISVVLYNIEVETKTEDGNFAVYNPKINLFLNFKIKLIL